MPQSNNPRALIGYISFEAPTPYFATPVYKNTVTNNLEFHMLDDQAQTIVAFRPCGIDEESYTCLPGPVKNKFQNILVNSPALLIIAEPPTELFVGTIHDVREEFKHLEERYQQKFFFPQGTP